MTGEGICNPNLTVGYLIQNIENDDADLRAAIANVRQDVKSSRSNFENAVAVLLPVFF